MFQVPLDPFRNRIVERKPCVFFGKAFNLPTDAKNCPCIGLKLVSGVDPFCDIFKAVDDKSRIPTAPAKTPNGSAIGKTTY
jgi:hypothetical protein